MTIHLSPGRPWHLKGKSVVVRATAAAASLCLLASACSSSPAATKGTTGSHPTGTSGSTSGVVASARRLLPSSVKSSNVLQDYVNIPYVPMEFYKPGTQIPTGIDIEIAQAIGKVLGVKMQFTNVSFPDLFTSLQAHRAQLVISGAYDAPARRGTFEYIDYFRTGTPILTTKADASKYHITSFKSLCGKAVATGVGTDYIAEIHALSQKDCGSSTSVTQILSNSNAQDYINLADGRVVAVFDEGLEAAAYFLAHQKGVPDSGQWEEVGPSYYPTDYGIILLKGSPLEPALFAGLQAIINDGTYAKILAQYHVSNDAVAKAELNKGPAIP